MSRSATEFLRRCGIIPSPQTPGPRLDTGALLARRMPLEPPLPPAEQLLPLGGDPPPDRAGLPDRPRG